VASSGAATATVVERRAAAWRRGLVTNRIRVYFTPRDYYGRSQERCCIASTAARARALGARERGAVARHAAEREGLGRATSGDSPQLTMKLAIL
jgi:hypothetical protein